MTQLVTCLLPGDIFKFTYISKSRGIHFCLFMEHDRSYVTLVTLSGDKIITSRTPVWALEGVVILNRIFNRLCRKH